ncbi:MAG: hypothetical protein KAG14_04970 [Mycoplasmataceae bacterium]|nr:hypothetical protein [Mycoplasmataceae bacterium]
MKIKKITLKKIKSDLVIQTNSGDKLYEIYLQAINAPITKGDVAKIIASVPRQVDYYVEALGAMGVVEWLEYRDKTLVSVPDDIPLMTKKEFAISIDVQGFILLQKKQLNASSYSKETKDRRMQSINAIEKWIGENK